MPDVLEEPQSSNLSSVFTTALFYLVAACLIFVGFRVTFHKNSDVEGRGALYLFAAAAGVLLARELVYLLPKLIQLKVGGVEVKLLAEVKGLKDRVRDVQEEVILVQGAGTSAKQEAAKENEEGEMG